MYTSYSVGFARSGSMFKFGLVLNLCLSGRFLVAAWTLERFRFRRTHFSSKGKAIMARSDLSPDPSPTHGVAKGRERGRNNVLI